MENHAHKYNTGDTSEHMHATLHTKAIRKKGLNNVISGMHKSFKSNKITREDETGWVLNVFFGDCNGQNKNSTVLKYAVWLAEMKYSKKVILMILIVGHIKNAVDHLFNALKFDYQTHNIYTVEDLLVKLNKSDSVTVHKATADDFFDCSDYFDKDYKDFTGLIQQNIVFSCEIIGIRII